MRYIVYYTIVIALIPRYTVSHDCADGELRMGFAVSAFRFYHVLSGLRRSNYAAGHSWASYLIILAVASETTIFLLPQLPR